MKIIKFDVSTLIFIVLAFFSGCFKQVLISLGVILFHELGHLIMLKIFKVRVLSVVIYPFGGVIKTTKLINYSLKKELIIALAGVFNQLILYCFFGILFRGGIINLYSYSLFLNINTALIIFNLLPIMPLDGSTVLRVILNKFFSYYKASRIYVILSVISLIVFVLILKDNRINNLVLIGFMIYKLVEYIKMFKFYKEKFVLERYLYQLPFEKIRYDKEFQPSKLRIGVYHYFDYVSEGIWLKKYYGNDKN